MAEEKKQQNTDRKAHLTYITTVFVDTQLWKTKHLPKRFQNFHQSYMVLTDQIKIHESQPLA